MKIKLIIMNFLQFAIWGAYLTSMGNYLGRVEMGNEIAWFYSRYSFYFYAYIDGNCRR